MSVFWRTHVIVIDNAIREWNSDLKHQILVPFFQLGFCFNDFNKLWLMLENHQFRMRFFILIKWNALAHFFPFSRPSRNVNITLPIVKRV
jgi:hypothetical protein